VLSSSWTGRGEHCRFCGSSDGSPVLDLGRQPGSELFPRTGTPETDSLFPLRLWLCAACGLAQLSDDVDVPEDPQGMQPDALSRQAEDAMGELAAAGVLPPSGTVVEFPSPHGGTWLPLLARHGISAVPDGEPADVVVDCSFGLMHARDQWAAWVERVSRLRPGGVLLVQFHSLAAILEHGEWNAVRHGHYAYYSLPAVRAMLQGLGLGLASAYWFPLYGGTILVVARRDAEPDPGVSTLIDREIAAGVLDPGVLRDLQALVTRRATRLRSWLADERRRGRRVFGYSAASRAVALLRVAGVDRSLLAAVADIAMAKQGTRIPGTDVPVVPPDELIAARPESVLLFVPDLLDEVRATVPVECWGGSWVAVDRYPEPSVTAG
jgi:hypothetical protein